ncbi:hypothetical protein QZJ86_19050 [Methylomonas montana]|uniref:hypothetical protein n=1 Tax=Methylomonas montana TaxID=3058963 RepID=UPI00265AC6AC|nr:hypothetical protein [Methylomonas montana]WKJ90083.1 hypothetical protein QZJ86_19050 [Methylomonas montana]
MGLDLGNPANVLVFRFLGKATDQVQTHFVCAVYYLSADLSKPCSLALAFAYGFQMAYRLRTITNYSNTDAKLESKSSEHLRIRAETLHGAAASWLLAAGQIAITDVYKSAAMDAVAGWQSVNQQNMLFLGQLLDLSSARNTAVWYGVFL